MDDLPHKSEAIRAAVAQLRVRFGGRAFDVVDWWPDDPEQIGLARPGSDEPGVCILTAGKAEGRFDVQRGATLYRDCLIQGLCWALGEELRRRG